MRWCTVSQQAHSQPSGAKTTILSKANEASRRNAEWRAGPQGFEVVGGGPGKVGRYRRFAESNFSGVPFVAQGGQGEGQRQRGENAVSICVMADDRDAVTMAAEAEAY